MRRGRGLGRGGLGMRAWSEKGRGLRRGVVWGRGGGRGGGHRAGFWEPGEPGGPAVAGGGPTRGTPTPVGPTPGQRWGGWSVSPRCDPIDGFVLAAGPRDRPPHGPHGRPGEAGGDTAAGTRGAAAPSRPRERGPRGTTPPPPPFSSPKSVLSSPNPTRGHPHPCFHPHLPCFHPHLGPKGAGTSIPTARPPFHHWKKQM